MRSQSSNKRRINLFWIKRHKKVLAVCDEELLNKKFKEKKLVLFADERFYKEILIDEKQLSELLINYDNINIIGNKAVEIAKQMNLIAEVKRIQGISYALIFKV